MARKPKMTVQEAVFAKEFVRTGSAGMAAQIAGYSHPATNGSKVLRRPHVQDSVRRAQARHLTDVTLPKAVKLLETVLEDEKARNADRIQAAKVVLTYTLGRADADGGDKAPEDMTADELAARIALLRTRQVELSDAAQVIEHVEEASEAAETDVFG